LLQSRSQSFVPLDQRSANESSRSIHFQVLLEITEFCISQPRPQGSLLSCAGNIGTPGQAQRHSDFEWLCKHNRLRSEPIRFVRLDSEHAQSDGKAVNLGLPELDLARGRDPRPLTKTIAPSGNEIVHIRFYCAVRSLHLWYLWRIPEMDAPRALVFRPLVKGNEALGTRLILLSLVALM